MKSSTLIKTGAVLALASSSLFGQCSAGSCPRPSAATADTPREGSLADYQAQQRRLKLERLLQVAASNDAAGTRVVGGQRYITGCPDEVPYEPYEKVRAPSGKIYYLPKPPPLCHPIPMLVDERDPGGNSAGANRQTMQETAEAAYMLTHNGSEPDLGEQHRRMTEVTAAASAAGRGNVDADRKLEELLAPPGAPPEQVAARGALLEDPQHAQPNAGVAERQTQQDNLLREQAEQLRAQAEQLRKQQELAQGQANAMAELQAKLKALEDFAQTVRVQTAAPPLAPEGPKPVINIVENPENDKMNQGLPTGR